MDRLISIIGVRGVGLGAEAPIAVQSWEDLVKIKNFSVKMSWNLGFQSCINRFFIIFGLFFSGKKKKIRAKLRQFPKNICFRTPMISILQESALHALILVTFSCKIFHPAFSFPFSSIHWFNYDHTREETIIEKTF